MCDVGECGARGGVCGAAAYCGWTVWIPHQARRASGADIYIYIYISFHICKERQKEKPRETGIQRQTERRKRSKGGTDDADRCRLLDIYFGVDIFFVVATIHFRSTRAYPLALSMCVSEAMHVCMCVCVCVCDSPCHVCVYLCQGAIHGKHEQWQREEAINSFKAGLCFHDITGHVCAMICWGL